MPAADGAVLDALRKATGDAARTAGAQDAVGGVRPSFVAAPADTQQAADVLRVGAEHGLTVVARGSGTKLDWGAAPTRLDVLVDTGRLDAVIEHAAGDLIVAVQAGVSLDALQRVLRPARQRLALDPVRPQYGDAGSGTVGGVISTAAAGPLRLSHGSVRDLLIGVTMVRADGVVAKAGGKVVKNVAGYDLGKLLTGSFGTLGIVTEAVFRLHPLPSVARYVVAPVADDASEPVQRVIHSQTVPTAVELDRPAEGGASLAVLVEGVEAGVAARVRTLLDLLPGAREQPDAPAWWGVAPWQRGDVGLRLTHEIAGLPSLLSALDAAAARHGVRVAVRGAAGAGVLHAALPDGADVAPTIVTELREAAAAWGGDVVVLQAPAEVRQAVDVWGPVRGLSLMCRVKDQFDPQHRLAPGRFVGGI